MAVSEYESGKVVTTVPIGDGVDSAALIPPLATPSRQTPTERSPSIHQGGS